MTRNEILALEECELNEAVAETVLGYTRIGGSKPGPYYGNSFHTSAFRWQNATGDKARLLDCSTWESVGLIVAEMVVKGYRLWLSPYVANGYTAVFSKRHFLPEGIIAEPLATAESHEQIPLAVARAALLALREEE